MPSATILVIDDDASMRKAIALVLETEGYLVETAQDGNGGVAAFRRTRPDLVITDVIMPEKGGIEAIREMRGHWPGAKIIAISGGGRIGISNVLGTARASGAMDVIAKPFFPDELLSAVERCLELV
jgi:two-component system chemotaxis response regulator CheY